MQKLQKLQRQNEDIYQNSKLLRKSPSRKYRNYRVKKNIPPEFFDSSWPRLHTAQQKYTHIKNLKLPRRSYRNYRVKRNAYIEILNCLVSLPADTTKTTAYKWTYPLNSLIFTDLDFTLHSEKYRHVKNPKGFEGSKGCNNQFICKNSFNFLNSHYNFSKF